MSDIVIGAIIGITGVIIGGILTSINNWVQIKHLEKEALIGRRIKAREGYLIPLRQALSKYMSMLVRGVTAYAVLEEMQEKGTEPEKQKEPFKTMMNSLEAASEVMKEIEMLSGQTSDASLSKMILDLKNQQPELELILKNYSKWFADLPNIDPIEWGKLLQQYNFIVSSQLNRLIPINKRIEELLCGEKDA